MAGSKRVAVWDAYTSCVHSEVLEASIDPGLTCDFFILLHFTVYIQTSGTAVLDSYSGFKGQSISPFEALPKWSSFRTELHHTQIKQCAVLL